MSRAKVVVLTLVVASSSCAYDGAQFSIDRDRSLALGDARDTVSIFGVYRDGRMSPESWSDVAPVLGRAFARDNCESFFDERLRTEEPELFERVDREAKQDGVSAELLAPLAPRAQGAFIVALQLFGRPPSHERSTSTTPGRRSGRGDGGNRRAGTYIREERRDDRVFEASLLMISAQSHQRALSFTMQYSGSSVEDALQKFATRLGQELPNFTCVGWRRDPK